MATTLYFLAFIHNDQRTFESSQLALNYLEAAKKLFS